MHFEPLTSITLPDVNTQLVSCSQPSLITVNDPASQVLENFHSTLPCLVSDQANIDDAWDKMQNLHTHNALIEQSGGQLIGLISSGDILGAKPITIMQNKRIQRGQVKTHMVMTPLKDIPTFTEDTIAQATVGHILVSLKTSNSQHALVVHQATDAWHISGLFSLSQISKHMHLTLSECLTKV